MSNITINNDEDFSNYTEKITKGIYNIELLINYAAEQGIKIRENYIQAFTNFKETEKNKTWTAEKEADFWIVYTKISKHIKPVSVEDIIFVENQENEKESYLRKFWFKKPTIAKRIVRTYIATTFIFIIITLGLQIYAITGSYLVRKVVESDKEIVAIEKELQNLILITNANESDHKAVMERENLMNTLEQRINETRARINHLNEWLIMFNVFNENNSESISSISTPSLDESRFFKNNLIITVAKDNYEILNTVLNAFILPILYGILGALIFTLRSLKTDIQSIKYKIVSNKIKYLLHIAIGALAGLIINLFFRTNSIDDDGIISLSFSPNALSFVAGYSVEIIFNAMDKIIVLINNSLTRQERKEEKINEH